MTRAVAIVSGGMDSTVLAYYLASGGYDLHLVSVDYGQRHARELEYATRTAVALGARHSIVAAPLAPHLPSALTGVGEIPHGHYAAENMRATVVPNRNAILLGIAWGIATADQAELVATGVHAGDHPIYPDCRPEFIAALTQAFRLGTETYAHPDLRIAAPFVELDKTDIAALGDQLGVPFADTWSCYQGGTVHCGRCGTCRERIEAFDQAGVTDPTVYDGNTRDGAAL